MVANRRRRNRISSLKKKDGNWCNNDDEVKEEILSYFQNIFQTNHPEDSPSIMNGIPHSITEEMNKKLTKPVTEKEIQEALFSMHPNKAAGPDGMSPLFFQKFWLIVKHDLVQAISSFFHSGHLLKSVNETLICLIPKVASPTMITQLRPISLCNISYKVIAKILTNRLKHSLSVCISPSQSAFILGRQIIDNTFIAHEYVHFLNNKRVGKDGYLAIKLDMSKAYDRVEWNFLKNIMIKMGFCELWIAWIFNCHLFSQYKWGKTGLHQTN